MARIINHTPKLDFRDVLIVPRASGVDSRRLVNLKTRYRFRNSGAVWEGLPLVSSNMDSVTGLSSHAVLQKRGWVSCFPKHLNRVWAAAGAPLPPVLADGSSYMLSTGISSEDLEVFHTLVSKVRDKGGDPRFICVDVANGYLSRFVDVCASLRRRYKDITIVAGNVVTPSAVEDLVLDGGVDIVKIGIGSGQACLTRRVAGVGYPQLSAVIECSEAAHGLGAHVMSDGGVACPGDVAKALCGGAHFVMIGSMLGAHNESPGSLKDGKKEVYGMSSSLANSKHNGGLQGYRSSEGRVAMVPLRGPLEDTLLNIEGGLRSACTYVGAKDINALAEHGQFVLVARQLSTELDGYTVGA